MALRVRFRLALGLLVIAWIGAYIAAGGVAMGVRSHLTSACIAAALLVSWPSSASAPRWTISSLPLLGLLAGLVWAPVTQLSGWMLAAVAGATWWVCRAVLIRTSSRWLIPSVILGVTSAEAMLGLWQASQGELVRGTLRNPNHFAGALALALGLAVGWALDAPQRSSQGVWRGSWRFVSVAVALLLGAVIVLGGSRGGMATAVIVLAVAYGLWRCRSGWLPTRWRAGREWPAAVVALGLWGFTVAVLAWRWIPRLSVEGLERRLLVYQGTVAMILDHLWLGIGPGQYRWRFRPYQRFDGSKHFDHAHNDYLQLIAEWGLPVAALLLFWVAVQGWRVGRAAMAPPPSLSPSSLSGQPSDRGSGSGDRRGPALAVAAALMAPWVHGLIDFDLQIPALIMPVAALLAWASRVVPPAGSSPGQATQGATGRGGLHRSVYRLAWGGALVLGMLAVWRVESLAWSYDVARGSQHPEAFEKALRMSPGAPTHHFRLALLRRDAEAHRQLKDAHEHFLRAIELNPYSWRYRFELGRFYERVGRHQDAASAYRQALQLNPWNADYQHRVGSYFLRRGTPQGASQGRAFLAQAVIEDRRLLQATGELLLSSLKEPKTVVSWWPREAASQYTLLSVFCQWLAAQPTQEGAYENLLASVWQRWLDSGPAGDVDLQRGDVYIRYLMQHGQATAARQQWLALAAADGQVPAATRKIFAERHNEIWNGDFEAPLRRGALSWQIPKSPRQVTSRRPESGINDSHALLIDFDSAAKLDFRRLRQHLVLNTATLYEIHYDVRSDALSPSSGVFVQVISAGRRQVLWQGGAVAGTTPWQRISGQFEVPAHEEQVILRLAVGSGDAVVEPMNGRFWLDEMMVSARTGDLETRGVRFTSPQTSR